MMMLEIVLCFLTISGLGASFEIEISRDQVAIKNGTFSPARTVLDCNSASQKHVYCCWIAPQMKDCKCDEKDCPLDGVSVTSDQRKCSLTIEHQDASANSGQWTCQLYNFAPEVKIANASTELFIINVNEVPLIRQTTPAIEFVETPHVTKEAQFECVSSTEAPLEKYQWYFRNRSVSTSRNLRLNLTRKDFNESVKCVIQKMFNTTHHVVNSVAQKDLILNMTPKVIDMRRLKDGNYEITVESWPMPKFVRVSSVEGCDNQCVIYKLVKGKYMMDKSPYLKPEDNFVQEIVLKGQVYGAKVRIDLVFNSDRLKDFTTVFVSIGNDLNVANVKIDLLHHQGPHGYQLASDSNLDQSSFIVTIVIVGVTVLSLVTGLILLVVFRQQISESFKCGVYLVPHDDEDLADDQEKKIGKTHNCIPPETEF